MTLTFEAPKQDRISDFELKLMEIESEHLGIPDTSYKCHVKLPANEFQRIIRDISVLGDSCTIAVSKEGDNHTPVCPRTIHDSLTLH